MEALRTEAISKDFGGVQAVRNISFKVGEGEHLAIIGPNGAGKTTLFNMLGGQLIPTTGRVFFEGRDITHMAPHRRVHLGIARTFQIVNLFLDLTVLDNIQLAFQGTKPSRFQLIRHVNSYRKLFVRAEQLLTGMDMWKRKDELVNALSYGEQRKLEIALSLASGPKLLLLDEPSCGLTAAESAEITSMIHNLESGITVIFVAHDMDLVFGVAQRIIVLHYGEIIVEGQPDEIKNNPKVKEIYMGFQGGT
ncbi:MAG: ABC transporter ATP-binding protein [Deltaproteobacteria bacterium]|nr:ABC transporter ATP-binding protein [Deltaproteobacteria bacterium]